MQQPPTPSPAATIYLSTATDSLRPLISTYSNATGNATLTDLAGRYLQTHRNDARVPAIQAVPEAERRVVTTQVTAALLPSSLDLPTVEVTASRTTLEVGVGKQVLRIGSDLMSDGSSVLEGTCRNPHCKKPIYEETSGYGAAPMSSSSSTGSPVGRPAPTWPVCPLV